jgi:transcriptional regulator with XRE-family HTH domain
MVRIKDVRLGHGWTMAQLADRIGEQGVEISEAGISNVENGNKKASDRLLVAWSRALGLDPLKVWHGPLRKKNDKGVPTRRAA